MPRAITPRYYAAVAAMLLRLRAAAAMLDVTRSAMPIRAALRQRYCASVIALILLRRCLLFDVDAAINRWLMMPPRVVNAALIR